MYIKGLEVENFRNFRKANFYFNEGVNAIIGHNNAGKSNLIDAIGLIINSEARRRLQVDDFNRSLSLDDLKREAPYIRVTMNFHESKKENKIDLDIIGTWLVKIEHPYEALLTYKFYLPEKYLQRYKKLIEEAETVQEAWYIVETEFLRLFVYKIWGGNADLMNVAEGDLLRKFSFQYLDAIRDVERDMMSGKNKLLKSVLDFFIDYSIKNDVSLTDEERSDKLRKLRKAFLNETEKVSQIIQERLDAGKGEILSYARDIGAAFNNAKPNFSSLVNEEDFIEILKLVVEYPDGVNIPATRNGLGYNNLIFMSLLLSKMQIDADGDYLGSNAKFFPVLAIEEPEAHLHPSMQRQFLKFMRDSYEKEKVRQIFVTTHSTHIASTLDLDEMICLYTSNCNTEVINIGEIFEDNDKSKSYVQRFFDATKTDMLFANKVLFVEGLAEQLLISVLAEYTDYSLEKEHVSIVNVNGKYFKHFLMIFDSTKEKTLNRRVACITDIDPSRKKKAEQEKYKKCYPYELNIDAEKYEYKLNDSMNVYQEGSHPNIASYSQNDKYGKTLEYEIAYHNPTNELILVDGISNIDELKELMRLYRDDESITEMLNKLSMSKENTRIKDSINASTWSYDEKAKAVISSRYLNSLGKGENALELMSILKDNLSKKGTEEYVEFCVPQYIMDAVKWVCE